MVVFVCSIQLLANYNHVNDMNDFMGKCTFEKKTGKSNIGQHFYKRYDGVVHFIANILEKI